MKVVLSRKSMDSQYGGLPSPIFDTEYGDKRFYPLPIPFEPSTVEYKDIQLFDSFSVDDFINDVAPNFKHPKTCHLDPDIRQSSLKTRPVGWQRAFGQVKQAQAHLERHEIGIGDVFLFFGWFQFAEFKNGKFSYKPDLYPNGFHAIYGYLQVDKVFKPNTQNIPKWLNGHPHVKHKGEGYFSGDNNTIYVAKDFFDYDKDGYINKNGACNFVYKNDLILTKSGQKNRTIWELPSNINPSNGIELSYNPFNRWSLENNTSILNSAGRGQEFIFTKDPNGEVEKWCYNLIKHHTVTD